MFVCPLPSAFMTWIRRKLPSFVLLNAIFPFSPGNVPNADCCWFDNIWGNITKMVDYRVVTISTPTSRKR